MCPPLSRAMFAVIELFAVLIALSISRSALGEVQETPSKQPATGKSHVIELGVLPPDAKRVLFVPFQNQTNSSLVLYGQEKTCACTALSFDSDVFPAGEKRMVRVDLKVPSSAGDHEARYTIWTAKDHSATHSEYVDDFVLRMAVRAECTFVPEVPILSTALPEQRETTTIRVVNYSSRWWQKPYVEFSHAIPFECKETSEVLDGEQRQVLVITVDRRKLATVMQAMPADKKSSLAIYSNVQGEEGAAWRVGETEVRLHEYQNVEVHPNKVGFDVMNGKDVSLIVVCRVPAITLAENDFVIKMAEHELAKNEFQYNKMSASWGRLTIKKSAMERVEKTSPFISVEVPALSVARRVRIMFADAVDE